MNDTLLDTLTLVTPPALESDSNALVCDVAIRHEGQARPQLLGENSFVVGGVLLLFLWIVLKSRSVGELLQGLFVSLFQVKERSNLFVNSVTNERHLRGWMLAQTTLLLGLLVTTSWHNNPLLMTPGNSTPLVEVGASTLAIALFLVAQWLLLNLVGWLFGSSGERTIWMEGFVTIHLLLGMLLLPIVFTLLVSPQYGEALWITSLVLYVLSRLVFICNGARIFLKKRGDVVYFILYLCALEIVPLFYLERGLYLLRNFLLK